MTTNKIIPGPLGLVDNIIIKMGTHFLLTFWLVQVLLFVSCSNGQDADERWIHTGTNDGKFYDSVGRERLFHGVNRVKKAFPWLS